MREDAIAWYDRATTSMVDWPVSQLISMKDGAKFSVVIPARDEQDTIGEIVDGIRLNLVDDAPLVDELVVIDSDSSDATARIAADHGATVHAARDIHPELGIRPGKGEALWKSMFVTSGDVLVFIDADLTKWGPHFVTGLLGPLLAYDHVHLVKGFYDRLSVADVHERKPQGGRVTELVARPLLNLRWPQLSAVVQPLAGEWAIRRSAMEAVTVPAGYGVEMAVLLDVWSTHGLDAIAQVDLGERGHSQQSVHDLGVMAAEIIAVAARRAGIPDPTQDDGQLWQFDRELSPPWRPRRVPLGERPAPATVPQYLSRYAREA